MTNPILIHAKQAKENSDLQTAIRKFKRQRQDTDTTSFLRHVRDINPTS
jgi:hypothetical protein